MGSKVFISANVSSAASMCVSHDLHVELKPPINFLANINRGERKI
jgi:hypothetical protein